MEPSETTANTHRWWTRPVRWLWLVLRFIWLVIFVNLLLGGITSFLFLTKGTVPHSLILGEVLDWMGQNWILSLASFLLLIALTVLTWVVTHRLDSAPPRSVPQFPTLTRHDRDELVQMFRQEYRRRLAHSLQGVAEMILGLQEITDITRSSAQLVFSRSETAAVEPFPPGTTIVQAYDEVGKRLLILGEPGTGKTTLLLELANDLLTRAERDPAHPFPVILNLSSWALKKPPLATWLIDQMNLVYGVPSPLGRALLEQRQWLFLLDGLDEVEAPARSGCIEAINSYRGAHFGPLVICSRSREYLSQEARLALPSAVEIQPLDEKQVTEYLKQGGKPVAAVRAVTRTNPTLRQLITTPLMLSVIMLAYRDKAVKDLPQLGDPEQQQQQIFADYVERVLEKPATRGEFTPQQTIHWLVWLAKQMAQRSQTELYIERMQPDWLPGSRLQRLYLVLVGGLLSWLIAGVVFGLIGGLVGGLVGGLLGLGVGLIFGVVFGLGFGRFFGVSFGLLGAPLQPHFLNSTRKSLEQGEKVRAPSSGVSPRGA